MGGKMTTATTQRNYKIPKKDLPLYSGKYKIKVYEGIRDRLKASNLPDPKLTENAVSVLGMRYLRKSEEGEQLEVPRGLVARVASFVAYPEYVYNRGDIEKAYSTAQDFYRMMANREFMPNSPTLMNAGREMGMLSACFVLPIEDSIDEIFDSVKTTAMIQKAGGGTGFTFDHLRPTGDYIKSSGGTTSGPISFWRVFVEATNAIQQGAFRRGANMGMMSAWHPDILRFINTKEYNNDFYNFNTSVKVTEDWMKGLLSNPDAPLIVKNPRNKKQYYIPKNVNVMTYTLKDLIPLDTQEKVDLTKVYTNGMLWKNIVTNAQRNGDPGIIFIDRMNRDNPTPSIGNIESTNPCGEQPLLPYEACNLGSINLEVMIKGGKPDFDRLKKTTKKAVRFLDNVIDMNNFPIRKITDIVAGNRKIGLGVMGWAEMLIALRVRYDSGEAILLAEQVMKTIHEEAISESEKLAEERGPFPNFGRSIYAGGKPRRNATLTTIAPAGTISIISGTSSGIEPIFGTAFSHRDSEGTIRKFTNPTLRRELEASGINANRVFEQLFEGKSLSTIEGISSEMAEIYITSHEVPPEKQIAMQAAFQKYVHNAVSKTINLVETASVEDIDRAYRAAFLSGVCKGITVYRNGSRGNQPIMFGKLPDPKTLEKKVLVGTVDHPLKVPEIMPAVRIRQDTPFGHIHSQIVCDPSNNYRPLEVFGLLGNSGQEESATLEAFGRVISLHLRSGGYIEPIIEQFIGIGSGTSRVTRAGHVESLAMGLAKCLLKYVVAKNHFSMEDLFFGNVDYDKFSEQVSDMIREAEKKEGGLLELMKGFRKTQDFIEVADDKNSKAPTTSIITPQINKKKKFSEKCPVCRTGIILAQGGCPTCTNQKCGYSKC